mgnify:CR=1 FL=1
MTDLFYAFAEAAALIARCDPGLIEIVALSLRVSLSAVVIGTVLGMPLGAAIAIARFRGRGFLIVCVNALMGLPPVVVGLLVYLQLSSSPAAMIIAQTILVTPIVIALTRQFVEDANRTYDEELRSLGVRGARKLATLLMEVRYSLITVVFAGFGRAIAEVGAVMIVGGNIHHVTRVMTTAITLETSKGNLGLALALGIVLMLLALLVNGLATTVARFAPGTAYA